MNKSSKEFWDFDENINYITVNYNNKKYNVIYKFKNYINSAIILYKIDYILNLICQDLYKNYNQYSENDKIAIECFLSIHMNNNYKLSEMQLDTIFEGLNKPRDIYKSSKLSLGKDTNFRAKNRHIFLTLRRKNGSFKSFNSIINLFIHEITHTMCNHIKWRDDDHGKDFNHYENLIKKVYKNIAFHL